MKKTICNQLARLLNVPPTSEVNTEIGFETDAARFQHALDIGFGDVKMNLKLNEVREHSLILCVVGCKIQDSVLLLVPDFISTTYNQDAILDAEVSRSVQDFRSVCSNNYLRKSNQLICIKFVLSVAGGPPL